MVQPLMNFATKKLLLFWDVSPYGVAPGAMEN
jgi:hypothetical protein